MTFGGRVGLGEIGGGLELKLFSIDLGLAGFLVGKDCECIRLGVDVGNKGFCADGELWGELVLAEVSSVVVV